MPSIKYEVAGLIFVDSDVFYPNRSESIKIRCSHQHSKPSLYQTICRVLYSLRAVCMNDWFNLTEGY